MLDYADKDDPRLPAIAKFAQDCWLHREPGAVAGQVWIGDEEERTPYREDITEVWQVRVFPTSQDKELFETSQCIYEAVLAYTDGKHYKARQAAQAYKDRYGRGVYHTIVIGRYLDTYCVLKSIPAEEIFGKE